MTHVWSEATSRSPLLRQAIPASKPAMASTRRMTAHRYPQGCRSRRRAADSLGGAVLAGAVRGNAMRSDAASSA